MTFQEESHECSPLLLSTLSLSLLLLSSSPAEASKVLLLKKPTSVQPGEPLVFSPFSQDVLSRLLVEPLADYETMMLVEVSDDDFGRFSEQAIELGITYEVHPAYDRIRVNGYDFESGTEPALPTDLQLADYQGASGLYLVQLAGPPTAEWSQGFRNFGGIVLYYPENTFLIDARPGSLAALRLLPGVQHVSVYQPAYKIRPGLLGAPGPTKVLVQLDASQDLERIQRVISALVKTPIGLPDRGPIRNVKLELTQAQIRELVREPEVLFVDWFLTAGFSGERQAMVAVGLHQQYGDRPNAVSAPPNHGGHPAWLDSKGFCGPTEQTATSDCSIKYWTRVALIDSGLDENECSTDHPTCNSGTNWVSQARHQDLDHASCDSQSTCSPVQHKFFCVNVDGDNVCEDPVSGDFVYTDNPRDEFGVRGSHGSHVASVIAGDPLSGTSTNPADGEHYYNGMGLAPAAQIVLGRLTDTSTGYMADFTPAGWGDLITSAHQAWARFANNSWNAYFYNGGGWPTHDYTPFSQRADQLVRDARGAFTDTDHEMTIVFSVGNNSKAQANLSVSPANAKNILSVGSSRSWLEEYGTTGNPCGITDEHLITDIDGESLRGVRWDSGRFKPDLVAPGQFCSTQKAGWESTADYKCFGGTSSAAPVVTGAAVLLDAWYFATNGAIPTPAMLKAILVAHADDMDGGTDFLPNPAQNLGHRPTMPQGWGRVNIGNAVGPDAAAVYLDEDHDSLNPQRRFVAGSGAQLSFDFDVDDTSKDVIIVIAYTDRYSAVNTQSQLAVNDLDLTVRDGIAWVYCGNSFNTTTGFSVRHSGATSNFCSYDPDNNVEMVRVPGTEIVGGDFKVQVTARNLGGKAVPGLDGLKSNQDFALYVYNAEPAQ